MKKIEKVIEKVEKKLIDDKKKPSSFSIHTLIRTTKTPKVIPQVSPDLPKKIR